MKQTIQKEILICDQCGKNEAYERNKCLGCGKAFCHRCEDKHAVKYNHAVSFSGSGDAVYCKPCNLKLLAAGTDKVFNAYLAIADLRAEREAWGKDFQNRQNAAEALLYPMIKR